MNSSPKTRLSHPSPVTGRRTWRLWWRDVRIPVLIIGGFGVLLAGLVYFQWTLVTGTELNTATWELRNFSFRRDPFTNFQLAGVSRTPSQDLYSWAATPPSPTAKLSPSIASYMTARSDARWDLVRLRGGVSTTGAAAILVDSLEARSNGAEFWPSWSSNHPNRAKLLWPAVQDLVELGLYSKLPKCLELAMIDSSLPDFKDALQREIQSSLLAHCRRLKEQGLVADASIAARVGLNYGDNSELQDFCDARSVKSDRQE